MGLILSCIFHFIERCLRRQDQISNHENCRLSISNTPDFVKSCCGSYISNIRKISLTWLSAICDALGRRRGSIIFSCIFRFIKKNMSCQDQVETDNLYRHEHDSVSISRPELLESLNDTNSSFILHQNVVSTCIDMAEKNDQGGSASAHVLGVDNLEEETENSGLVNQKKRRKRKRKDRGPERELRHYCSSHKILLVGEGDFSFSASLAVAFGSATNMVATSLDSREMLLEKYTGALANLKALDDLGCTIVHEVDATTMSQHALLKSDSFDRIVFNFPHADFFYKEHETTQIELHRKLVKGFRWNAYEMLTENGEVHITHKTAHPFSMWNIEKLAEEVGLGLLNKVPFSKEEYPGYHSKRGHGIKCNRSFRNGECSTFIFQKQSCLVASQSDAFLSLNDTNSSIDMVEENEQGVTASAHVLDMDNLEEKTENRGPERWLQNYCSSRKMLLVGEGDFSFSASLAIAFGSATNMVATSLDSREMLLEKYTGALANLKKLEKLGCTIVHEVDATTMSQHAFLKLDSFDRIVFNFPHAGFFYKEHETPQIELHKKLVKGFLWNAYEMLTENGEVHITHKTAYPFSMWNIEKLAEEVGLGLLNKVPFSKEEYPGYRSKRGHGIKCNRSFRNGECGTFIFQKQSCLVASQSDAFLSFSDTSSSIDMVEENDQGVTASAHVLGVDNLEEKTENRGPERWLQHYCSSHKMLLVGEGDFSFSASLAIAFGSATNMVATSLDSREMLLEKYTGALANLKKLEELGCTIVHEVDATTMSQHAFLKLDSFDRIVFNFPHAGFFYKEHETPQIDLHKKLVKGFLWNAYEMLTENGEVHITHKTAHPFSMWNIEKLAEEVGLGLRNKVPFSKEEYPGYCSKRGHGIKCNRSFRNGECGTFIFQKQSCLVASQSDAFLSFSDTNSSIDMVEENDQGVAASAHVLSVDNLEEKKENRGPERWLQHYCSSHKMLLVGEGDFSFSASLAVAFGSATNMVATSLDSREMLLEKYTGALANLKALDDLGCTIVHEVDATTMSQHALLKSDSFDRIVFNFPHAGFLYKEHETTQIELHQRLVKGFLWNAYEMLTENGEVHITHKTAHPFSMWNIEKLAEEVGLGLLNKVPFSKEEYPGYHSKRGHGIKCNRSFRNGECSTFIFQKQSCLVASQSDAFLSLNDTNFSIDMVEENDQGVTASAQVSGVDNLEEKTENRGPERWLQHYCSSQKMLLVGEGDFSFSASLAVAFGSATNMVATSLDSREMLLFKYSGAMENLKKLEELGCTIVHEVDATAMSQHALLKLYSFDRIVFNFPHAGFFYQEHETPQIE
ncbi:hypothetical protein PTKIN_Ptkin14bG0003100 [Pterospermum kingtungense]